MYINLTAYCDENGEMNPETAKKIAELLPDIDDWITYSLLGGKDEHGEYMCYSHGEDDFYAEDGITELEGEELQEAKNHNRLEVLGAYIKLEPHEDKEIIRLWIDDGSQFGRRPTLEAAKKELEDISITPL